MTRIPRLVITIGSLLVLAVLAIDSVLVSNSLDTLSQSTAWVDRSRQVIVELEPVLSVLKDAETAGRGFLLTGDDGYLAPLRQAESQWPEVVARLRTLSYGNTVHEARIVELSRIAAEKMVELRQTIALRRERGLEAALEVVQTGRGKDLMGKARGIVSELQADEEQRLQQRLTAPQAAKRRTLVTFAVTTGTAVLLLLFVFLLEAIDARARENAAEVIRKSEAWLSTTLASIGDAVIATNERGEVRFLNAIAQSLTGWTQAEAVGKPMEKVFAIVNEATRQPAENPVARVIREGMILGLANHTVLISRDGHEIPIDDSAAPIKDDQGRIAGVVLVFRDITERRQQEEVVAEQTRLAEEANHAKDQFLAVLSHELRTPLNPILLAVTSMLEQPRSDEDVQANLEMIRQYVNLQARLIDDLLDVMRIVRGKMPLHWEAADAHSLIEQAVRICRSELLGKQLELDVVLAARNSHINADPARLQQVFWNLIKNAVKFTPDGGSIAIRTRNVAGGPGECDRLIIAVSDSGIGIAPEALARVFDPFQQGETSITRRFGGLGLGLAISKGIIEGHGGLISAASAGKDRGTTFTIELPSLPQLPVAVPRRAYEVAHVIEPVAPAALKILLVEDEQATVRLMAKLLRGLGHQVTTACTIADALNAERADHVDLIISDIGLPDGSGLELMRQVGARRGHLPAIALTGYGMEEDIQRSREAGFTAHMTKPIDFTKLEAMIRQLAS